MRALLWFVLLCETVDTQDPFSLAFENASVSLFEGVEMSIGITALLDSDGEQFRDFGHSELVKRQSTCVTSSYRMSAS